MATKRVSLYVCPTDVCPSFYGSDSMPELEKEWTGPKTEDKHNVHEEGKPLGMRHTRAGCPLCRIAGRGDVERKLVTVHVSV